MAVNDFLRVRSDEDILDDLRSKLRNAEHARHVAENEMLAFDEAGDPVACERASRHFDHWDHEAARIRHEIEGLEEHIALQESRRNRAYYHGRV